MSLNIFRRDRRTGNVRPPYSEDKARYHSVKLVVDFNQNLVNAVDDVAKKRGVSLYGQIRDFVEQGVRNFNNDHRCDSAVSEECAPLRREWQP